MDWFTRLKETPVEVKGQEYVGPVSFTTNKAK